MTWCPIKVICDRYKEIFCLTQFYLCETSIGLLLIVLQERFPLFQTNLLSLIAYNLVMFLLISYVTMHILTSLQLIYWEVCKVSVQKKKKWKLQ